MTDAVRTEPTNQWEREDTNLPNEMQKLSGQKGVIGQTKSSTYQQEQHHPNCPEIIIHPEEVLGETRQFYVIKILFILVSSVKDEKL